MDSLLALSDISTAPLRFLKLMVLKGLAKPKMPLKTLQRRFFYTENLMPQSKGWRREDSKKREELPPSRRVASVNSVKWSQSSLEYKVLYSWRLFPVQRSEHGEGDVCFLWDGKKRWKVESFVIYVILPFLIIKVLHFCIYIWLFLSLNVVF